MKYLWIVMLVVFGGLWSIAAIRDVIDCIRYGGEPEPFSFTWLALVIAGLFFWSLTLWCAG